MLFYLALYRDSISGSESLFSLCRGNHWPRAVTIDILLESGHGLSHESAQDGCIGICVKLEASNNPHEVKCGMFMGSTGLEGLQ